MYLFMTLTPFKTLHQFSSRYVAQFSILFLNDLINDYSKLQYLIKILLLILGGISGCISLHTYYYP
jgi:hypothetical protein